MLEDYLNQTCTLRYKTGTDARGHPVLFILSRHHTSVESIFAEDGTMVLHGEIGMSFQVQQ